MLDNLHPCRPNRCRAAIAAAVVFAVLLLPMRSARAAPPKQTVNPAMPQMLQKVAEQLPDPWHPRRMPDGDVQLRNPAQRLNARVGRCGIHLLTAEGFTFNLRLVRFGFSGALKYARFGGLQINGARVDVIRNPDLGEWIINSPAGIEHGFRLTAAIQKPKNGRGRQTRDIFELHFKLGGDLIPELTPQGLDFKDRGGRIRMHYNQLLAYDAVHQMLPAHFGLTENHVSISVDITRAVFPVIIDPLFSSQQPLTAGDAAADDRLGSAVAVDADAIALGAPLVDSGAAVDAGAVYVFVRDPSTGIFSQQQKLTADDADADDRFGSAVYLDGNTLVVGAPLADSGTSIDIGAVYVFTRDPNAPDPSNPWRQEQKLTAADARADDRFGSSVYVEGHTLVGGAPRKDAGASNASGAAYVFTRDPDAIAVPWTEQQKLTAADAAADDQFGTSVSLNGNTIVVGAPLVDSGTSVDIGAVYVFARDQTVAFNPWAERQKLTADDSGADDRLGSSVSLNANTILAGAPRADTIGATDAGAAYIFTRNSASVGFNQDQILNASNPGSNDQFGASVFVNGATAMIGAPLADVSTATDAGRAYFFSRVALTGDWRQQQVLTAANAEALSEFGRAVGFNAATAAVGSSKKDQGTSNSAGAAFVFVLEPEDDEISQQTDMLTAADAASNDRFGSAVGLSGDNALIGIADADPGGDLNAGEVSAFERDPGTQVFDAESSLTASDKAAADNFGAAVSVDADTAVIGAPDANIGGEDDAGAAYVFNRDPVAGDWRQAVKLTAEGDVNAMDRFGASVALDADTLLVGAPFHDPNTIPNAGAAFLYSRDPAEAAPNQWRRLSKLTAGGDAALGDRFGTSAAINSDTVLVGAPFENGRGAVFVFVRDPSDNSWERQQKLAASDAGPGDQFGYSVAVYGNTALIGAPRADASGVVTAGVVYVFTRDPLDATLPWTQVQKVEAFDAAGDDAFGAAVALVGNMAVVGAPGVDLPPNGVGVRVDAGAAYDFRRDPILGLFRLRSKLTALDAAADEAFGAAVVLGCDTVVIGAPDADLTVMLLDAGAAFVFQTFEAREDSDDGGSVGGLNCFIGAAESGLRYPITWILVGGIITVVIAFLRDLGRKSSEIGQPRPVL